VAKLIIQPQTNRLPGRRPINADRNYILYFSCFFACGAGGQSSPSDLYPLLVQFFYRLNESINPAMRAHEILVDGHLFSN
jgi:hypothetical protein